MEATDGSRAIMFHNIHGFEKDYLIDPKTFNAATGDYPDVTKVFNIQEHEHVVTLSKEQIFLWHQLFRSINNTLRTIKVSDPNKTVHLFFKKNFVKVKLAGIDVSMKLPASVIAPDFQPVSVNAEYMRDAMEVFKKMEANEIEIRLFGPFRPIHFEDKDKTEIIVLPIRSGGDIKEEDF